MRWIGDRESENIEDRRGGGGMPLAVGGIGGIGAIIVIVVGLFLARWAMLSVQGPLSRLVTAAERFGSGDLRPVTVGEMPREFRVTQCCFVMLRGANCNAATRRSS